MFDAIVLATSPHAETRVLGLTLAERGRRVAAKTGARRVLVVTHRDQDFAAWLAQRGDAALVVVRAGDQVVHKPLIEPLLAGAGSRRIAVRSDGSYAGAVYFEGDVSPALVLDEAEHVKGAEPIPHGDIAVHPAITREDRAGATQMLLRLNIKKEDNPVTKHCYRPLSRPLTRVLVNTPFTPNQISYAVGVLGVLGCILTALPGQTNLIIGAAVIWFAGVLDGCDGEIARLKLIYSPYGAWLDTVVDEITTTGYFMGIAIHVYAHHPSAWIGHSIWVGTLAYVASIYAIYYYCIVVAKVGGSQFYVGTLEVAEGPRGVGLRAVTRSPTIRSPLVREVGAWLLYIKTRDFINLAALGLTFINAYWVIYYGMLVGGVITALVIVPEHIKLRLQLGEVARRGGTPHLVT